MSREARSSERWKLSRPARREDTPAWLTAERLPRLRSLLARFLFPAGDEGCPRLRVNWTKADKGIAEANINYAFPGRRHGRRSESGESRGKPWIRRAGPREQPNMPERGGSAFRTFSRPGEVWANLEYQPSLRKLEYNVGVGLGILWEPLISWNWTGKRRLED